MRRTIITLLSVIALVVAALATTTPASASGDGKHPVPYRFLPNAVVGGAQADAPGSNNWRCRPTKRHPRPVVLVHGTAGNQSTNWQTYAPLLANNGYCVFALTYGVTAGTPPGLDQLGGMDKMETSARQLKAFVARVLRATGARKVDLVGHSQGTLMPNYWVKFLGGARFVKRYVSLAPLWHGTGGNPLTASMGAFAPGANASPICAACPQMSSGSAFMTKMRRGGVAVKGIDYTNIVTQYDQLVIPYTSGIERGMRNIVVQSRCASDYAEHFEIAADPVAASYVLNALDPAHPRRVPCTTVLPFVGPPV